MTEGRLDGHVAIVTGGASGIGKATCHVFAQEGAHVVVADISDESIARVVAELPGGEREHLGVRVDVRDEAQVESMAQRAVERFGGVDILVASAGVLRGSGSSPQPLYKISVEEWDQVLDTNLKGMFLTNRAVLPHMIKKRRGNIVNLSSVQGKRGSAHDAPYCASKFGVIGMSEALAEEVGRLGVRVQIVMPDAVRTPIWDQNGPIPCPDDALPPERVASLVLTMVTQPWDTILTGVTIAPFKTRRRKSKKDSTAAGAVREQG